MVATGNKCTVNDSFRGGGKKKALLVLSSADICLKKELFVEQMSGCSKCGV